MKQIFTIIISVLLWHSAIGQMPYPGEKIPRKHTLFLSAGVAAVPTIRMGYTYSDTIILKGSTLHFNIGHIRPYANKDFNGHWAQYFGVSGVIFDKGIFKTGSDIAFNFKTIRTVLGRTTGFTNTVNFFPGLYLNKHFIALNLGFEFTWLAYLMHSEVHNNTFRDIHGVSIPQNGWYQVKSTRINLGLRTGHKINQRFTLFTEGGLQTPLSKNQEVFMSTFLGFIPFYSHLTLAYHFN